MQDNRLRETRIGSYGFRVLEAMYRSFAVFAELGIDIIVDDVIFDPNVLQMAAQILGQHNTYFIGVRCPRHIRKR